MELYTIYTHSTGISIDSRDIKPGNIFFAIAGENFDGHHYVKKAIDSGALCAIIDKPEFFIDKNKTYLVENTLKSLQNLANYHRKKLAIPILAITGTNGKTSTKELCYSVLSQKYQTQATKGNFNNHIGVPLSLLNFSTETEIGIIEMGANHPGEIKALCQIAEPNMGIITNIGKAHLEGFGTFEAILKAKKELFDYLEATNADLIIYNSDDNIISKILPSNIEHHSYGTKNGEIVGKIISNLIAIDIAWRKKGEKYVNTVETQMFGEYNLYNILAAISLGIYYNVSGLSIRKAIAGYQPANNRSQIIQHKQGQLIIDAYNANPESMKKALTNFNKISSNYKKTAILGDMYELGEFAASEHQKIIDWALNIKKIEFIFIGEEFFKLRQKKYLFYKNRKDFLKYCEKNNFEKKLILIKGSRAMRLEEIIEYL